MWRNRTELLPVPRSTEVNITAQTTFSTLFGVSACRILPPRRWNRKGPCAPLGIGDAAEVFRTVRVDRASTA